MFRLVVLWMVLLAAIEIWGLIMVGERIGAWNTVVLILLTGGFGAYFAVREARRTWQDARAQLAAGQMPGQLVIDGICILLGGLLLILPGFITDMAGLLLLFPPTRAMFRRWLLLFIRRKLTDGSFRMYMNRRR